MKEVARQKPVIPATQEIETKRPQVQGQCGQQDKTPLINK